MHEITRPSGEVAAQPEAAGQGRAFLLPRPEPHSRGPALPPAFLSFQEALQDKVGPPLPTCWP